MSAFSASKTSSDKRTVVRSSEKKDITFVQVSSSEYLASVRMVKKLTNTSAKRLKGNFHFNKKNNFKSREKTVTVKSLSQSKIFSKKVFVSEINNF